jgi:hypothetical protein
MRATLAQTVEILYLLETGNPYLFIDSVSIRSRASLHHSINRAAPALRPPSLDVQFELSGYLRGGTT